MDYVVFDLETQDTFDDVGKSDPAALSISVAGTYDSKTDAYTVVLHNELEKLWHMFEHTDVIIGYNSNHFDIPLLDKYYPGDLYRLRSIDLLESIKDTLGKRIRLDNVALATLGKGKSGHGLQAVTWWKEGKIDEIKKYCQMDVEITKDLFEYARAHGKLKYKDGLRIKDISIDTTGWDEGSSSAMTHSLPF